jgi:D-3-phosphoglycerate dehydrogenase / 2-oxoglutarate reductase
MVLAAGAPCAVLAQRLERTSMRILVADRLPARFRSAMTSRGHECVVEPALTDASLPGSIGGVDVLVVRSTRVTADVFSAADSLRLVVRAGSGTNTIDCDEATRAGVLVANVPGVNSVAVAELTLGLLLAVDRAIPDNTSELRAGRWDKQRFSAVGRGLYGRSLGIVGLGNIGIAVAERAGGFGMRLLAQAKGSRSSEASQRITDLGIELVPDLVTLASQVDVLSLHVPLRPETRGMVGAEVLDALQPGILLNTSRAEVVDAEALLARLDAGELSAGLDVFPDEPGPGTAEWRSPLAAHPRVVGTHHVGASTRQAQEAVADGVAEVIDAFARGELLNVVNGPAPDPAGRTTQPTVPRAAPTGATP